MITFTINADNNITVFGSGDEAAEQAEDSALHFDSQSELTEVSAEWPLQRFVEIWNSIPGQTAVSRFADRTKAVARLWKAIQPLAGSIEDGKASRPTGPAPRVRKQLRPATSGQRKKPGAARPRRAARGGGSNKKAAVIALLKRTKGATLDEIVALTGWQKHTVRGFVSILGSQGGEKIESSKSSAGERTYRIKK